MSQIAELVTLINFSSSESENESTQSSTKSKSTNKRGNSKQYCHIETFGTKEPK